MTDEQKIDPRFDPAFQRGFDGPVTTTRRRLSSGASVLPASETRPPVAPTRITVEPVPAPAVTAPPAPATAEDADELPEDAAEPTRPNAIYAVLFVIAGVVTAFGIWATQYAIAANEPENLSDQTNYALIQMLYTSAPMAIALGIAIAAAALLVIAAKRR